VNTLLEPEALLLEIFVMSQKDRLLKQLHAARGYSTKLLADFDSAESWTHQLHEGSNHALWFVGHMGTTDNFMLSLVRPEWSETNEQYGSLFGLGSQPSANIEDYPPVEQVLAFMQDRREKLLATLESMDIQQLEAETPEGAPAFMPDNASVFETAVWHEGLHSGQLSLLRRSLGFEPLV
tara:strand:+ start:603 stop:1142 length:540 start_codon:yes stop_codon:yes gene_type:complete